MASAFYKADTWAYAPVPKGPVQRKILGATDGFAHWRSTKVPDAVWEAMKLLARRGVQVTQLQSTGLPQSASRPSPIGRASA